MHQLWSQVTQFCEKIEGAPVYMVLHLCSWSSADWYSEHSIQKCHNIPLGEVQCLCICSEQTLVILDRRKCRVNIFPTAKLLWTRGNYSRRLQLPVFGLGFTWRYAKSCISLRCAFSGSVWFPRPHQMDYGAKLSALRKHLGPDSDKRQR